MFSVSAHSKAVADAFFVSADSKGVMLVKPRLAPLAPGLKRRKDGVEVADISASFPSKAGASG